MEQDCPDAIQYTIFGSYFQCVKHGQQNILYNGKNQAYCSACSIDYGENNDDAIPQPTIRKKYIQMMKSEPMNEFVKEGGMFDEHMRAILYHTFLVIILWSTVLAKSVEEEVCSNYFKIFICRDHSEWYTPHQTGEIMSEGIGTDGDVSVEGVTLLYKPVGHNDYWKILYTHMLDDKRQNALTVWCNIKQLLNDIDRGKNPC
jgi:hypothetical protein